MDSLFLYTENYRAPLEVGCLQIYDPSTSPRGEVRFKEILATFQSRLDRWDLFRQRLVEVPLSLDYPYWIDDKDFDLEYHVRHISLPKPGDWRQLMAQIGRLQARQLDHSKPLWMAHIIGGLDNVPGVPPGCFAMFTKFHHAAIDGVTGQSAQAAVHDIEPIQADASDYQPSAGPGEEPEPSTWKLLARTPFNMAFNSTKLGIGLLRILPAAIRHAISSDARNRPPVPRTVFNPTRVSPNRVIDGRFFDLEDFKRIRSAQNGVTVNDVALAVVSGAMRYYLQARDGLPAESLVAGCPINVGSSLDAAQGRGNLLSIMTPALHTDITDPAERLCAIHEETEDAKVLTTSFGKAALTQIPIGLPAPVARNLYPLLIALGALSKTLPFNTFISNIAIRQKPLYLAGAKLVKVLATAPPFDQWGIFHTAMSFDDKMCIGFTACREMMPDPEFYSECIETSFDDLKKSVLGKRPAAKKKVRKKKAKSQKAAVPKAKKAGSIPKTAAPPDYTPRADAVS
jgi:WS/DGAT/MGAT family acyltransferase